MTLTLPPTWLFYVIKQEFCSQCDPKLLPVFIQIRLYQTEIFWSNVTVYFIKKFLTQNMADNVSNIEEPVAGKPHGLLKIIN